jgi:membrane-associated phospholipid phosphatase
MIFLILYLEARLRLLQVRYIKPLIQLAALIAAFVTSISRISDYRHRFSDVFSGSVLGIIVALYVGLVIGKVLWVTHPKPRRYEFGNGEMNDTIRI